MRAFSAMRSTSPCCSSRADPAGEAARREHHRARELAHPHAVRRAVRQLHEHVVLAQGQVGACAQLGVDLTRDIRVRARAGRTRRRAGPCSGRSSAAGVPAAVAHRDAARE